MIEITSYQLRDNTQEGRAAFRAADFAAQEALYVHRGMRRRTTACAEDGSCVTIAFWSSDVDANTAAQATRFPHDFEAVMQCIDHASVQTQRYEELGG